MPLLPEIAAFLDEVQTSGVLPAERYPDVASAREAVAERRRRRMIDLAPIGGYEDTVVLSETDVPVRIYRPRGAGPHPIVVWIHGGGWTLDGIEGTHPEAARVCQESDAIVISVGYRLAPEHPYPAALDDCVAVAAWAEEHAAALGGDGSLGIGGVSSGGNLAAAVALLAARAGRPRFACQVLVVPCLDAGFESESWNRNGTGYLLTRQTCEWFIANYLDDPRLAGDWRVSPLRASTFDGVAPAFILTAEYDPLRDDGFRYAERLRQAGVSVHHTDVEGVIHGFLGQIGPIAPSEKAFADIGSAFRRHLRHDVGSHA
ncbi:alpha/beta hydrolase fold domain-containing protein [Amycolatopsis pithecellobii]|uniref:Alpha/beta hydrolase fold domain-containing protein n=1 Tax=Amycolatopsis pithecellobii TaxID=664692 RepID=A0A6N7YQ68_9PSEU|nr:alpha/beta hydrolase [Amycolatopsis pithecellobii]MTD55155.1 alpha/beta hydrolase fold domain-containing protein [Amycolatopsis pithecellobii]